MAKMKDRTLLQKLTDVMPPYLANYLCWYYSDPDERCSWDELCSYDVNFKQQGEHAGENKTEDFCEKNWLIRDDVQKGMIIYMQHMKRYADENKKWLNIGFKERFEMFKKILNMQGISVDSDVDVIYNVSMPVASTEMIANLKALQEMGAISRETIMEKTEYITDVDVEKKRLQGENVSQNVSRNGDKSIDNPSKDIGNK